MILTFTYGFTEKTIRKRLYLYFWAYSSTGHKNEKYVGPAGKAETEGKALQFKLQYFKELEKEASAYLEQCQRSILEVQEQLKGLPISKKPLECKPVDGMEKTILSVKDVKDLSLF